MSANEHTAGGKVLMRDTLSKPFRICLKMDTHKIYWRRVRILKPHKPAAKKRVLEQRHLDSKAKKKKKKESDAFF